MLTRIILILSIFIMIQACDQTKELDWAIKVGAQRFPKTEKTFLVKASGDSSKTVTKDIQDAIDACALAGGGIVTFSPGVYVTGSIFIKSNVHLRIDREVLLLGSQDFDDYPEIKTRIAGIETTWPAALINVIDAQNVAVTGEGIVNARGKFCWNKYWKMREEYVAKGLRWIVDYDAKRVRTLLVQNASDVTLKGLTFKNAGFWTVQLLYSHHLTVDGLVIKNNEDGSGPSTDGIDVDSSSWVLIQNCDIDCNDDNFCLKAGRDADGLRVNRPTFNVVIRDCIARRGHGLITFGSETSGGIYNVEAYNLKAYGTSTGIRFKSTQGRGGTVRDAYIHDIQMHNVREAVKLDYDWYPAYNTVPETVRRQLEAEGREFPKHWKALMQPVPEEQGTPYIRNITIRNIKAVDSETAISANGRKNQPAGSSSVVIILKKPIHCWK